MNPTTFPKIIELWKSYEQSPEVRKHVLHNIQIHRCIRGGLKMAQSHRLHFEPRSEYWRRPERRFLLAYFASYWGDRMTPVKAVRAYALEAFKHFDPLHERPAFRLQAPDFEPTPEALDQILEILLAQCASLQVGEPWEQLRRTWKKLKLPNTAAEHLGAFFQKAIPILKQNPGMEGELGIGFQHRLPWFAYLGCMDEETLYQRQAFFYGLANLVTTSNAYIQGGGMVIGPLLQNTSSDAFMDAFTSWSQGGRPGQPPLLAMGPNDEEPKDCSHYRPIVECYGFLNLERVPYYNQAASVYGTWVGLPEGSEPLEIIDRVGDEVRRQLGQDENKALIPALAATLKELNSSPLDSRVWMEWTRDAIAKKEGESLNDLADAGLLMELQQAVVLPEELSLAAACLVHLLLDSRAYGCDVNPPQPGHGEQVSAESGEPLPKGLRPFGELALAILNAGKHVLLAGAPGTGKTTLAKFVARSWNEGPGTPLLSSLEGKAPFMTVANSAWSPFHTIGGMFPDANQIPKPSPGVFIDPASLSTNGAWSLRSDAMIVDELNRADMDRCIGELYPLLSGSASLVHPAGMPGVQSIKQSERFRVIATANMNLADLVFPMSEGLARRFQLIELPGASMNDVMDYLQAATASESRFSAAKAAVKDLFDAAKEENLLLKESVEEEAILRLRFGVGFFGLLRDWVTGHFKLPATAIDGLGNPDDSWAAPEVLVLSLTTASASDSLKKLIKAFRSIK